jgi:hypothetical protein
MSRAYLCVSIDIVSDQANGWEPTLPRSFAGITHGVLERIHPLFERFGARPTYLLAPEVLRAPACVAAFRALAPACELGTHLPASSSDRAATAPEIEIDRAELTSLTDAFIRAFEHQPQSFRATCSRLGPTSIGLLESLGYLVDASVTPHVGAFHDAPSQPYRPDTLAPGLRGDATLLEVPITIRPHFLGAIPGLGRRLDARARWLRPTRGTAAALLRVAEDEMATARRGAPAQPVILHAMLRNVDVLPSRSPSGGDEAAARSVLDSLRALLAYARREAIPVIGLSDVSSILATAAATDRRHPRNLAR